MSSTREPRHSDPPATDRRPLFAAFLAGLSIVFILATVAIVEIFDERHRILAEAGRSTTNLARTLEEHSRLTFEAMLHSFVSVQKYVDRTPGALRVGDEKTLGRLRQIVDAAPYLLDLKVIDRNGVLVSRVIDQSEIGTSFMFKSAIGHLRDNPEVPFVVSHAIKHPKFGGSVIFMGTRLRSPDGRFLGIAVGALDVTYFNRFYEAINVGEFGAIKLVRRDGVILTRWPEGFIGKSVAKGPLFATYLPKSATGTIDIMTATDGLRRILSYRALKEFPLVVVVSAGRDEVLATWRQKARLTALFATAVMLLFLGLIWLFFRLYQRQAAGTAERHRLETQFLNAIEHVQGGVALFDADDRLVVCNSRFASRWHLESGALPTGHTFEELLRGVIGKGGIAMPPDGEERWVEERMERHRNPGEPFELFSYGRWRLVHENRLPDGGLILISTDVTDLKQREQESRDAMEAAKLADASKTRFLEAANHDLRQPLQALNLMSYALVKQPDRAPDPNIVQNMRHAIDAMESVLNGLLDIGKFEAGRITPRQSNFRLSALFGRIMAEFSLQAETAGVELRVVGSSLIVRTDFDLLSRIIENFVSNALRYTASGRVLLGARRRDDKVCIEVWDTGSGIPEDQLENIFEEFYQLQNPARDRRKGLGLGLSIVDRIAELLGVTIHVRSSPGRGSVFSVAVPRGFEAEATPTAETPLPLAVTSFANQILLIEDDLAVLEATRIMLEGIGARVACAMSREDALSIVDSKGFEPDLVVSDHRLPEGETGVDLLRQIGDRLGRPVPGVIITGDTSEARIRDARRAGYPVLRKPVDPERLLEIVDLALSQRDRPDPVSQPAE